MGTMLSSIPSRPNEDYPHTDDEQHIVSVFPFCLLGIILTRFFPPEFSRKWLRRMLNYSVRLRLRKGDVLICQSPHFWEQCITHAINGEKNNLGSW